MNWLEIDIFNILLGYMEEDKADDCLALIMDRINNPQNTVHILNCEEKEQKE